MTQAPVARRSRKERSESEALERLYHKQLIMLGVLIFGMLTTGGLLSLIVESGWAVAMVLIYPLIATLLLARVIRKLARVRRIYGEIEPLTEESLDRFEAGEIFGVEGPLDGNELSIRLATRLLGSKFDDEGGFGLHLELDTIFEVCLTKALPVKLHLSRAHRKSSRTGDPAFDVRIAVRAKGDSDAVLAFLTPERRAAILAFDASFSEIRITDQRIRGTLSKKQVRRGEVLLRLQDLLAVTHALSE